MQLPAFLKNRKTLLIIIIIAAAAAVAIALFAYSFQSAPVDTGDTETVQFIAVEEESFSGGLALTAPERPAPPFMLGEVGFKTDDPNIRMIEINQALSYGYDYEKDDLFLLENFVAGKETGIFVVLEDPVSPASEISLTVIKDGDVLGVLLPTRIVDERTIMFRPKDIKEMGDWGQGAYIFIFEIDGVKAYRSTNFLESMNIRILAVPLKTNNSGLVNSCTDAWRDREQMIIDAFPVAKFDVEYIVGPELDVSSDKYDLDTEDGAYQVWKTVKSLQTPDNEYTLIIGFLPQPLYGGEALGISFDAPATLVCESEIDMLTIIVEEVSRCFYIEDKYMNEYKDNALEPPLYRMTSLDAMSISPVEGSRQKVAGGYSYIENAYTRWISSGVYNQLFNAFTRLSSWGLPGHTADEKEHWGQCPGCLGDVYAPKLYLQCQNCSELILFNSDEFVCDSCGTHQTTGNYKVKDEYLECPLCRNQIWWPSFEGFNIVNNSEMKNEAASQPELIMVTQVTGFFHSDGSFTADPWYTYPAPMRALNIRKDGEYSIIVYDSSGKKIGATYFDVEPNGHINTEEGHFPMDDSWVPINIIMKHPDGAAKFVVQKGDKEVYTRIVSEHSPEVDFTEITFDQKNEKLVTAAWEASDADGDELHFQLYYCVSEEEYHQVAFDITEKSFTIDLSGYPGSESGYFYIYATDGINTAEAKSEYFGVSFTAPFIIADNKTTIKGNITDEIWFDPKAYDNQDGWLGVDYVDWLIDGEPYGVPGTLWIMPYQVDPGLHTFTCVATNSGGVSTSKDFKVEIINDESALPDDWSRCYVRYALQNGIYLPLNRIEAPVTRSQYALQMAFLYGTYSTHPGVYPTFDKDSLVKDCGNSNLVEAMMVYLGVMEAPDGKFDPARSMTEREGAVIMYKVAYMAENQGVTSDDFNEDEIIDILLEKGVIDESGPNALDPDRKLSSKLAMVRIAKLMQVLNDQ